MHTSVQALVVITEDAALIERAGTGAFADRTLAGSVAQIVDAIGRYAELGFGEFIVPDANLGRTAFSAASDWRGSTPRSSASAAVRERHDVVLVVDRLGDGVR